MLSVPDYCSGSYTEVNYDSPQVSCCVYHSKPFLIITKIFNYVIFIQLDSAELEAETCPLSWQFVLNVAAGFKGFLLLIVNVFVNRFQSQTSGIGCVLKCIK